MFLPKFN